MFTYRLHLEDGSDVGEASYPSMVTVGEELSKAAGTSACKRVASVCRPDGAGSCRQLQLELAAIPPVGRAEVKVSAGYRALPQRSAF